MGRQLDTHRANGCTITLLLVPRPSYLTVKALLERRADTSARYRP